MRSTGLKAALVAGERVGHRSSRSFRTYVIGAVLGACCTFGVHAQTWTELGPAPISNAGDVGRVSAIACHPTDPLVYYVGGADGGVWKTTNGAGTWTALTDDMPSSSVGAIALDPANPSVVYVGTGEANFANHSRYGLGVYRSVDGGSTWEHFGVGVFGGRCISKVIVAPGGTGRVWASVTRAGGFPELAAAKGHPGAKGDLGVFRSEDGGRTWARTSTGLPNLSTTDLAIDPVNPQVLYAAVGHIFGNSANGIYKTTDGGNSWAKLAGGLPTTNVGRIALAVAPSNANRLYAVVVNPCDAAGNNGSTRGGYRSDNAGASWMQIGLGSFQATYGWYLCAVSVRPTDPNTVIMGGFDLLRSTNSGTSFSTVTPAHVDMHAVAWDATGRLLVGDDGGVHRSQDVGNFWSAINQGLGTVQFYAGLSTHPTDASRFFGGTQDNGTNRRSTNSLTWTRVLGGDGGWTQLDERSPQRVFAEYQGTGNLFLSPDGGGNFQDSGAGIDGGDRNCFLPPYLIDPGNSQRMYYGTQRVYRSMNSGSTWSAISGDVTGGGIAAIRAMAMSVADPQTIYVATNDSRVLVSTNGGANFTLRLSDAHGWPRVTREIFVDPTDAATAYVAGARYGMAHVRRTRDRGATWETLDGDLPDIPVNVVAADSRCSPAVIYAGTDAGLYCSYDDGATWGFYGEELPRACVIDIRLEAARGRMVVATQGRGAWSVPIVLRADFNGDGFVSGADFDEYVVAFEAGEASADFDGDGFVTGVDFDLYVAAFEGGC